MKAGCLWVQAGAGGLQAGCRSVCRWRCRRGAGRCRRGGGVCRQVQAGCRLGSAQCKKQDAKVSIRPQLLQEDGEGEDKKVSQTRAD